LIFVDSNIPMYLVGADAGLKKAAGSLLQSCVAAEERLVTDAEVLQEILHRYAAIRRREAIQPAFDALLGVVDEVFAIEPEDVLLAKETVLETLLSARDALHLAVMKRRGIDRILTFDCDFDGRDGVTRIKP